MTDKSQNEKQSQGDEQSRDNARSRSGNESPSAALEKNGLEWLVFVVGCILLLGVFAYLIFAAMTMGSEPPDVRVKLGQVQQQGNGFRVPIEARNDGDRTAEGVLIEVVIERNGKEIESGEVDIAFLPRHSSREADILFEKDPRDGRLSARVLGYEKP